MDKYSHPQFMLDVEVRVWVLLFIHALNYAVVVYLC